MLCHAGDAGDQVFLVLTGQVKVEAPSPTGPILLTHLGLGACIGELAVLDPAPRSATVTATEPVRALLLEGEDLRGLARRLRPVR